MGRRPWSDRGKEIRRLRIALSAEDWATIEARGKLQWWHEPTVQIIQAIIHEWADSDRKRASTQLANGPIAPPGRGPIAMSTIGPNSDRSNDRGDSEQW